MGTNRLVKPQEFIAVLALLAALSALYLLAANPLRAISFGDEEVNWHVHHRQLRVKGTDSEPIPPVIVCGRPAGDIGSTQDLALQQKYATCPAYDPHTTPILVLEGYKTYGRTGNHLRSFLQAVHYARDHNIQLGIMYYSWAMDVLFQFFMASTDGAWDAKLEEALCVKIILRPEDLIGRKIVLKNNFDLFYYSSNSSLEEFVAREVHTLRTFFQHYNTGDGQDLYGNQMQDMCVGINTIFGKQRGAAKYSTIHLRQLEHEGPTMLGMVASATGCDPVAALEMEPDYVKSILELLGMLKHPIVIITDGQNEVALQRLMDDPDIGPMLMLVPEEASWIGGDITLATMSNVFIGNPASTFSTFIAESRIALGFGRNYLYRAKNEKREWVSVCGTECSFMGGFNNSKPLTYDLSKLLGDNRLQPIRLTMEQFEQRKAEKSATLFFNELRVYLGLHHTSGLS